MREPAEQIVDLRAEVGEGMGAEFRPGLWVAVSCDLPTGVLYEVSAEALRLWLTSLMVARRAKSDGQVSVRTAARLAGARPEEARELIKAGAWHEAGHGCRTCEQPEEGYVWIHGYLRWQHSRDQIEEITEQRREAGKARARQRAAERDAERDAERVVQRRTKNEEQTNPSSRGSADAEFEEWYAIYPRKVGRGQALKAYRAARKKASAEEIVSGLRAQLEDLTSREKAFIPHPATWLNGERWADREPEEPALNGEELDRAVQEWIWRHPVQHPPERAEELERLAREDPHAYHLEMRPIVAAHRERAIAEVQSSGLRVVQ